MATKAERAAAAAAKREAKAAAKKAADDALAMARGECMAVASRLPPEFQQWGAIRTRVWQLTAQECRRVAGLLRVKTDRLQATADAVRRDSTMTDAECGKALANLGGRL